MTYRTVNLVGFYEIASVSSTAITLVDPELVNPNWNYVDFTGLGTTGYAQNVSMAKNAVVQDLDLSGEYTVSAVTSDTLTLTSPEGVNTDWNILAALGGGETSALSAHVAKAPQENWIGPFTIVDPEATVVVANFVALNGLYKDDGKRQTAFPITLELELTPVDLDDDPIGPPETFTAVIDGNTKGREARAVTLVAEPTFTGRCQARARRVTQGDYSFKGTVVDEVKWKDLYALSPTELADFGDITTVHARTYATSGALALKERELNMLVTRKVPHRISGTTFSAPVATRSADDIMVAICTDPLIGNRPLSELDLDAIYGAAQRVREYFESDEATEFSVTLDDDNVSLEETLSTLASTIFCTAIRRGSRIELVEEIATDDSVLLFNHRNKLPGSERRSVRFGPLSEHDGIELEYTSPDDDSPAVIYIPEDRSAVNPRLVKMPTARSHLQAHWSAWRAWNKLRYQNTTTQFDATQEAALVAANTRILVADNTRSDTQDGDIVSQDLLELETSQPVTLEPGKTYTIFLQHVDGTVEALSATAGSDEHHVQLAQAPRLDLSVAPDNYARATYQIVEDDAARSNSFLVVAKEPRDRFTYGLEAINYSGLYYQDDVTRLWLRLTETPIDRSAWAVDVEPVGGALTTDAERGQVWETTATGHVITLTDVIGPASYTKLAWVRPSSSGHILSSASGSLGEVFRWASGSVHAGHETLSDVSAVVASGQWSHVAVTYDADSETMALYVNGQSMAVATGISQRGLANLQALGYGGSNALVGRVAELRLLSRALSSRDVHDAWLSTQPPG